MDLGICAEIKHPDGCVETTCKQCGDLVEALEPSRCFYCVAILCWHCWDEKLGVCAGCFADEQRMRRKARARVADPNYDRPVGRPQKLSSCPHCGHLFSATAIRTHKPSCPQRPARMKEIPWDDVQ